jgi:sugar lactone lactonase YvrE
MTAPTQVTRPAELAESPVWDSRRQSLLWVDITRGHVHRYDPVSGEDTVTAIGVPVGAVAARRGEGLILAAARGFAFLDERTGSLEWLWAQARGDRMNDGKCDPDGRFLAGTLTSARVPGAAALYRLDTGGQIAVLIENVTLSNGLGWSPDGTLLYFADTPLERVDVLDYDVTTGTVGARRTFADLREAPGRPDGLTVDADGGVWIAMARGGAVRRYTPDGRLDHVVELPVPLVTSVTFGGGDLTDLYVTTSREGLGPADLAEQPQAGGVFCLPASGARGLPANECALLPVGRLPPGVKWNGTIYFS